MLLWHPEMKLLRIELTGMSLMVKKDTSPSNFMEAALFFKVAHKFNAFEWYAYLILMYARLVLLNTLCTSTICCSSSH